MDENTFAPPIYTAVLPQQQPSRPPGAGVKGKVFPGPHTQPVFLSSKICTLFGPLGRSVEIEIIFGDTTSSNNTSTPVVVVVAAREGGRHVTAHFGQAGQTGKSSSKTAGVMTLLDGAKERSG